MPAFLARIEKSFHTGTKINNNFKTKINDDGKSYGSPFHNGLIAISAMQARIIG
jgi:hypothetical protein